MNMPVIRIEKTKNYTVMSNEHLRDPALSLAARGLMSMMLSLPDDWDYSVNGLLTLCKEGRTVVQRSLSEMEKAGYLTRQRINTEGGRFTYEYTLTESKQPQAGLPCTEKPFTVEPLTVKPCTVNQQQLNTDLPNTDIPNTDLQITEKKPRKARKDAKAEKEEKKEKDHPLPVLMLQPKAREIFPEFEAMRTKIKRPLTPYAKGLAVKKLITLAGDDEQKQVAILEQSIANSWQGLFPLSDDKKRKGKPFADKTAPPIANVRREDYAGDQVPW